MFILNCNGRILNISKTEPVIMGILNITPDSFYSGSRLSSVDNALQRAEEMIKQGAAILDIGGQSSRPHSEKITTEAELDRILPVIKAVRSHFPDVFISVDTFYAGVAAEAVRAGADMVNDISSGSMDKEMLPVVAGLKVPYIAMHMKGTPSDMHMFAQYENVTDEVLNFFIHKTEECRQAGINDIIVDPGFGFAKNARHNFHLLKHLSLFKMLNKPVLLGLSRKSTIYKTLNISPEEALNGTTILNTIGVLNGANILRVHDVKEAKEIVTLVKAYNE